MSTSSDSPRIVVIGAGLAGISVGIALKKELSYEKFTIYEKASDVGGTWRDNTYPGCGSDVPGHWYSLSTELNPHWKAYFATQPEIQEYWLALYRKHNLARYTVFNTLVASADWDASAQLYRIVLHDNQTGETRNISAEIVISAIGGFSAPAFPKDVPGAETFAGDIFHSAQWRHDVELKNKRVGVIGNGCSAAQFIPQISQDPSTTVINFCRTPAWFVPREQFNYPSWVKWMFTHVPLTMRLYRNSIMATSDAGYVLFRKDYTVFQTLARRAFIRYIKSHAPPEYHDKLIPSYPPGCKRLIVDPGYLDALKRPNLDINWTGIEAIVPEGIRLKTGEVVPLDVIIFGTGYVADETSIALRGSKGMSIRQYYESQGGPTAYLGVVTPGFPNFFSVLGPNTATGHASVIFSEEASIHYTIQLIKPIIAKSAKSFEVLDAPTNEWNAWLQMRLAKSVFMDCRSYYRTSDQKGKNIAMFPGPLTLLWWWTRTPVWSHFKGVGDELWVKRRRRTTTVRRSSLSVVLVVLASFWIMRNRAMAVSQNWWMTMLSRVSSLSRILIVSA